MRPVIPVRTCRVTSRYSLTNINALGCNPVVTIVVNSEPTIFNQFRRGYVPSVFAYLFGTEL